MVNKKGFIRTLEAVIAIIVILTFIFYITPRSVEFEEKVPEDVANAKSFILDQILYNKDYSRCVAETVSNGQCESVLNGCEKKDSIMELFDYIPYGYNYWCEICTEDKATCTNLPTDALEKSTYTNSIFVHETGTINYKTMRIYLWKK